MTTDQIAAQLFTVRSLCQSLAQTSNVLKKIRQIGYSAVEVAGIGAIDANELLRMTQDADLKICAIHDAPVKVLAEPEDLIDRANILGCDHIVYSYPVGFDLTKREDVNRLASQLREAGAAYRSAGKELCYHHHSLEFVRHDARTVLDHLVDGVPKGDLSFELDTYWIQHGGGSPEKWCSRAQGRLPVLHLKDFGNIGGTPTMMEIGQGNLDWPDILRAAEDAGCKWFVVEQDTCPGDPLDSLAISYSYIKTNLVSPAKSSGLKTETALQVSTR